jgi:hypothetical protein
MYMRGDFPHKLGCNDGSNVVQIAYGVKFHNVRTNNVRLLFGKDGQ